MQRKLKVEEFSVFIEVRILFHFYLKQQQLHQLHGVLHYFVSVTNTG